MTLADYLLKKQISMSEFSRLSGISKAALSRIMRGLDKPSFATLSIIEAVTKSKVRRADFDGEAA